MANEFECYCISCGEYCGEGEWLCINCKEKAERKNRNIHISKTKGKKKYEKRKRFYDDYE